MLGLLNVLNISIFFNFMLSTTVKSNYGYTVLHLKEIKLMQQSELFYSVSDYCNTTFFLTLEEKEQELFES